MFDRIASMLAAHGLADAIEVPFSHTGFSGATLTRLTDHDGQAFVLKRLSIERDWIMRATDDAACREAALADASPDLGPHVRTASVAAAHDRDAFGLLMRDIGADLLPPGSIIEAQLDAMPLVAPPAVELGWFLAINSKRLPASASLDDMMARYADAAELVGEARERHDALTVICGLLLRGWRKGLDAAEGDAGELRWWCQRVETAAEALG